MRKKAKQRSAFTRERERVEESELGQFLDRISFKKAVGRKNILGDEFMENRVSGKPLSEHLQIMEGQKLLTITRGSVLYFSPGKMGGFDIHFAMVRLQELIGINLNQGFEDADMERIVRATQPLREMYREFNPGGVIKISLYDFIEERGNYTLYLPGDEMDKTSEH